jgi:RNA polymerase sigma factor (sigma-70 family)
MADRPRRPATATTATRGALARLRSAVARDRRVAGLDSPAPGGLHDRAMRPTDADLLRAWAQGDEHAGDRLFRRYMTAVARFFRNKAAADLEDLVQQTFLGCLEGAARFRGDGSFRSYLFGVAYRVLGTYYRGKYRRDALSLDDVSFHDLSPGPSLALAERREHQLLLAALREIPLIYQVVLELYFWEEMTSLEIATTLDIPHGTAQTRLRRARELLADRLERLRGLAGAAAGQPADIEGWAASIRATL